MGRKTSSQGNTFADIAEGIKSFLFKNALIRSRHFSSILVEKTKRPAFSTVIVCPVIITLASMAFPFRWLWRPGGRPVDSYAAFNSAIFSVRVQRA